MSATARVSCKCSNEFQDKQYGKGIRVANATLKKNEIQTEVRCTVCKAIHSVNHSQVKK